MSWIWIAIFICLGIFILMKIKRLADTKQHLAFQFLLVFIILVIVSIVYVKIVSGISLTSYQGFLSLCKTYYSWVLGLGGNMKGITGYAIQQNWAVNSTSP